MAAIDHPEVVTVITDALERTIRRWRSPEEHAAAILDALHSNGWAVVSDPASGGGA